jgi:hypothetical protein
MGAEAKDQNEEDLKESQKIMIVTVKNTLKEAIKFLLEEKDNRNDISAY